MLFELEIIARAALTHVDWEHAAYLGLLTFCWLSWCICWFYVSVVDQVHTADAIPVIKEAVLGFVRIWERHGNVSFVQRLVLVLLMATYLTN